MFPLGHGIDCNASPRGWTRGSGAGKNDTDNRHPRRPRVDSFSVLIGGKAGDGITQAGSMIAHLLNELGYRLRTYVDSPSLIRGGHNFVIVRAHRGRIAAHRDHINVRDRAHPGHAGTTPLAPQAAAGHGVRQPDHRADEPAEHGAPLPHGHPGEDDPRAGAGAERDAQQRHPRRLLQGGRRSPGRRWRTSSGATSPNRRSSTCASRAGASSSPPRSCSSTCPAAGRDR